MQENRGEKRFPTIASEIQNVIKGCDNLVSDLGIHLSNVSSKLRANDHNMIGDIVDLVSHRITSVKLLPAAFNTSRFQMNMTIAHIDKGFRERKLVVWRSPYFFYVLAIAQNDHPTVLVRNLEWCRLVLKHRDGMRE
jgi:hypothetical protein